MKIIVRPAEQRYSVAAVDAIRRSISQLCAADHHNDHDTLAAWLSNKTPDSFVSWLSDPEIFCVVAESDDRLSGVGLLHRSGEIRLIYLTPGVQRHGIGKMIHSELEAMANCWGLTSLHLDSTAMARPFYESLGYHPAGPAVPRFGVLHSFPYGKQLQPNNSFKPKPLRGSA